MIDWTITDQSNAFDKSIGYLRVLGEMRDFVRNNVGGHETIRIHQTAGNQPPTTTLRMSANNFTVTHINGQQIVYNYGNLPTFYAMDLPAAFPTGNTAVDAMQKAKLLYLLPEAARSTVIENAFNSVISAGFGKVVLATYAPLVNNYGHTCGNVNVNINSAHPARPLTANDYCQYAGTLADKTPDKIKINALCNCGL